MKDKFLFLLSLIATIGSVDFKKFTSSIDERLKFQKTAYFLKVFGFDFGYKFDWYVYGPYSTELASDGYEFAKDLKEVEPLELLDEDLKKGFQKLIEFIGDKKSDSKWLELLASTDFLRRSGKTEKEIEKIILGKATPFKHDEFVKGWEHLKKLKIE